MRLLRICLSLRVAPSLARLSLLTVSLLSILQELYHPPDRPGSVLQQFLPARWQPATRQHRQLFNQVQLPTALWLPKACCLLVTCLRSIMPTTTEVPPLLSPCFIASAVIFAFRGCCLRELRTTRLLCCLVLHSAATRCVQSVN